MDNFQSITANAETLAAFLGSIPAIETPWDDAFHRIYCSSCSAEDCDDCRRPERDNSMLDVLDLAYMTVNHEKIPPNVLKEWVKLITDELSQISKIKRSDKARA